LEESLRSDVDFNWKSIFSESDIFQTSKVEN
jgi:hypothetical protein